MFRNDLSPIYMSLLLSIRKHLVPNLNKVFSRVYEFWFLLRETSDLYQVLLVQNSRCPKIKSRFSCKTIFCCFFFVKMRYILYQLYKVLFTTEANFAVTIQPSCHIIFDNLIFLMIEKKKVFWKKQRKHYVGRDNSVAKSECKRTDKSKPPSNAWATFSKNVYDVRIGNGICIALPTPVLHIAKNGSMRLLVNSRLSTTKIIRYV